MNAKNVLLCIIFSMVSTITSTSDDWDLFDDGNSAVVEMLSHSQFMPFRSATPQQVGELLIDVNAVGILQQEIYLRTNPFNQRDLVDLPIFFSPRIPDHHWAVGTHIFWNETERGFFSKHSSALCSYLAIQSPDLLAELSKKTDESGEPLAGSLLANFKIDPLDILPLFANMTIQQRRTGLMIHADAVFNRCELSFMIPFYYLERNFFLTDCEAEAVEEALGKASEDEKYDFARKHLVSDKLGFGDSRLYLDGQIAQTEHLIMRLGLQLTLPTAFALVKHLYGRNFHPHSQRPVLDVGHLIDLGNGNTQSVAEASAIGERFFLGVLDSLATTLIETELGNNRHVGIGLFARPYTHLQRFIHRPWAENFALRSKWAFEYLLPAPETRFFIDQNNRASFDNLGLNQPPATIKAHIMSDPVYAQNVVNFLQGRLVDQLYPFPFRARVFPGFIINITPSLLYQGKRWAFDVGYDFYLATKEKLHDIQVCKTYDGRPFTIDVCKATKPMAYQSKAVGQLLYRTLRGPYFEWVFSFNADYTFSSSGIGKDFSVSFNFEANF